MKKTGFLMFAAVFGSLIFLLGCSRYHVGIRIATPAPPKYDSSEKGNVHVLPVQKTDSILEVAPGLANLDQRWAIQKQMHRPPDTIEPSEFVTTANLSAMMQERTIRALQQAGFRVTEGDKVPGNADLVIMQSLQMAYVSLSGPSCPMAVVQVLADLKNVKTGAHLADLIIGHGRSFEYFTFGQGLELAMNEALEDYEKKLVEDTRDQVTISMDKLPPPLTTASQELWRGPEYIDNWFRSAK